MRTTILILLLTTPIFADEHSIRLKNGVTAYDALVYNRLPDRVYRMTDAQWFNFANARNLMARRDNRKAAFKQGGHTRYGYVTESSGFGQTRFGGGVGYGGFGGSGGYSGYLGAGDQQNGTGIGGFMYGAGRPGNSMQTRGASSSKSYTMEYAPWPAFNGGDVPLLNPYVLPKRRR